MKKEYDFSKMKEVKNPYVSKKKAVGINLSPEVIDYFKKIAEETRGSLRVCLTALPGCWWWPSIKC